MRRLVISGVTFLAGLFYILEFVVPSGNVVGKGLETAKPRMGEALMVIGGFAVGLGVIGVLRHHLKKVFLRQKDWYNSLALLISMFAMATFKIWEKYDPPEISRRLHHLLFQDMYNHGYQPTVWRPLVPCPQEVQEIPPSAYEFSEVEPEPPAIIPLPDMYPP